MRMNSRRDSTRRNMLLGWLVGAFVAWCSGWAADLKPGLEVSFRSLAGEGRDIESRPTVELFVPAGETPSPFVAPGLVEAEWRGLISVDLRADFRFQFEARGPVRLEINGKLVQELEADGDAPSLPSSNTVRLGKGTNSFRVQWRRPNAGDGWVRLFWSNRDTPPGPVPASAFSHAPSPEVESDEVRRKGRDLFLELRCASCHEGHGPGQPADLRMGAPTFDGIGSRRGPSWMRDWILDPKKHRHSARMPKIFQGERAAEEAESVARYLASLTDSAKTAAGAAEPSGDAGQGEKLFGTLHCGSCHSVPGEAEVEGGKLSLRDVRRKFPGRSLRDFLMRPEAHYDWIRMPNFHLSVEEAAALSSFLLTKAGGSDANTLQADAGGGVDRGRRLVQDRGCLQCHKTRKDDGVRSNVFKKVVNWESGCLSERPPLAAPDFGLEGDARDSLREFGKRMAGSLNRQVAADFARRQARELQCRECHGKVEGWPPFERLGEKINPEYVEAMLAGVVKEKPRPWLEGRMPSFPARASLLAKGLAHGHGLGGRSAIEPDPDAELVKTGAKLVSAAGGFSCTSCHSVGSMVATQVFEAPGVNLILSGSRLRKDWVLRWLRNPLSIDPTSKMPVYFDEEGKSPLTEILDGDGTKQREAIWQYLRLGSRMPAPPVP